MKNKIYMTMADMYNELGKLRGEHKDIIEAIDYKVENADEVIDSRGDYEKLPYRLNDIENKIGDNAIDVSLINKNISDVKDELLNKIPEVSSNIIYDENTAIGVSLGEKKTTYTKIIDVKPLQQESIELPSNRFAAKAYVGSYGEFVDDLGEVQDELSFEVSDENTTYNKNALHIGKNGLKLNNESGSIISPDDIILLSDGISIKNRYGIRYSKPNLTDGNYQNIFNQTGIKILNSNCEFKIEFYSPTVINRLRFIVLYKRGNFETMIKLNFEDGTSSELSPIRDFDVNVGKVSSQPITSIEVKTYALTPEPNEINISDFKIYCDQCKSKSDLIRFNKDISVDIVDKYSTLTLDSIAPLGSDIKFAFANNDSIYSVIPDNININPVDFKYNDGLRCLGDSVSYRGTSIVSISKDYSYSLKHKNSSTINLGQCEIYGKTFESPGICFNSNVFFELHIEKNAEFTVVPIYSLGAISIDIEDKSIDIYIDIVNDNTVAIHSSGDVSIDSITLKAFIPYNLEEDKEKWVNHSYSNMRADNIFINKIEKDITLIDSSYNLNSKSISFSGVDSVGSNLNHSSMFMIDLSSSSGTTLRGFSTINNDGFYVHKLIWRTLKPNFSLIISSTQSILDFENTVNSVITKYIPDFKEQKVYDNSYAISKKYIGENNIMTRVSPVLKEGEAKYSISFNGIDFFGYNFSSLEWESGRFNTTDEIKKLNDSMLSNLRGSSKYIYIKVKLFEGSKLLSINITFDKLTVSKVNKEDVLEKGCRLEDFKNIRFYQIHNFFTSISLLCEMRSFNQLNSPSLKKISTKLEDITQWVSVEKTDVIEYMVGDRTLIYKNVDQYKNRLIKIIITDMTDNIAVDMNRQGYLEKINEINEENKVLRAGVSNLMQSVSELMKTIVGDGGDQYIKDFMINSYKKIDCGIIQPRNVFVINNVKDIMGVSVWEHIHGNKFYSKTISFNNSEIEKYYYSGIEFTRTGVVIKADSTSSDVFIINESYDGNTLSNDQWKVTSTSGDKSVVSEILHTMSNELRYGTSSSDTISSCYTYCVPSYSFRRSFTKDIRYFDIIFDFLTDINIYDVDQMQYGLYAYKPSSYYRHNYYETKISVWYSYDNITYYESGSYKYSSHAENYTGSESFYGNRDYSQAIAVGKKARYLKLRIDSLTNTTNSEDTALIKHFRVRYKKDVYPIGKINYLYNNEAIDISSWKNICSIKVDGSFISGTTELGFLVSLSDDKDVIEWKRYADDSWENSSIDIKTSNTKDEIEALGVEEFKQISGKYLRICGILYTNNKDKTPVLSNIEITYQTSEGTVRTITANPHDYGLEFNQEAQTLTVENKTDDERNFEVLIS